MKIGYICFGIVKQNILQKNPPLYPLGKGNWVADQHAIDISNFLLFPGHVTKSRAIFIGLERIPGSMFALPAVF